MTTAFADVRVDHLEQLWREEHRPSATLSLIATGIGVWDWEPGGVLHCCARARLICGLPADESVTLERLLARIHPEDRHSVAELLRQTSTDGGLRSVECRTMEGEAERWISLAGRRCSLSGVVPTVAGVVREITESKRSALQRDLLVRELSHRTSNIFAVLSATIHVAARAANSADQLSRDLQSRIGALAVACAVPAQSSEQVALHSIVERELAPFSDLAQIKVSGEPTWLAQWPAMSMTLILHELATNAIKHGSLRREHGELSVRWWLHANSPTTRCIVLHWKEHSAERIEPPGRTGLGSSLMSMAARNVGGNMCVEFEPDGLAATIVLPAEQSLLVSTSPSGPRA